MRILFLSHQAHFVFGGEIVSIELMKGLASHHEVQFASPSGILQDRVGAQSFKTHRISAREFSRTFASLPRLLGAWWKTQAELKAILAREKIDIIHAMSLKAFVYALFLGNRAKLVWHHHNIMPASFWNGLWLRFLSHYAHAIVVPSRATGEALVASGVVPDKINIIYNGLDAKAWPMRPASSRSHFVVGFVGELSLRKGAEWLPELCDALLKMGGDRWRLQVIGDSLSEPAFGRRILQELSHFNERVMLLGRREDIPLLLSQMDVLVVPSQQDPLPTVIVEALWSALPIIARPVGGIPEMFDSGQEGFFVDSVDQMAAHIVALMADPELVGQMGARARKRAESQFSLSRALALLEKVYVG